MSLDFPSVKLNLFTKLEYYLILKKLDKNFQNHLNNFVEIKKDNKKADSQPTWEIEKKILYWAYHGHRHLGTPLNKKKVTEEKIRKATKLNKDQQKGELRLVDYALQNLETKGYFKKITIDRKQYPDNPEIGKTGYVITPQGLAMGELIFELCFFAQDKDYNEKFAKTKILKYKKFIKTIYDLQLFSIRSFYLAGFFYLNLLILKEVGLIDDLKFWIKDQVLGYLGGSARLIIEVFIVIILLIPFLSFFLSVIFKNICWFLGLIKSILGRVKEKLNNPSPKL
ncbi:MAG: hypothetical protein GF335_04580 [Candidatus Moranbacteria bacterium]|nr:hypothetical protein [Candidatus Moranbacteria bacterium]